MIQRRIEMQVSGTVALVMSSVVGEQVSRIFMYWIEPIDEGGYAVYSSLLDYDAQSGRVEMIPGTACRLSTPCPSQEMLVEWMVAFVREKAKDLCGLYRRKGQEVEAIYAGS